MTVPRLMAVAVALLCGCILVVTGCGSADTAITTITTITTETAQLYPVRVSGKWGFIDKTSTIKIEPQFAGIRRLDGAGDLIGFFEGLAAVAVGENDDEKWGHIDTSGARVIEPQFDVAGGFSEGLAAVGRKTGMDGELFYEVGYINTSGILVIPMERNTGSDFPEGLGMFTVMGVGYPSYFIDKTGAWVIEPQFYWASEFHEGLAAVGCFENDVVTYGYIDTTGTMVISPRQCTAAEPFSGGVAALTGLGSVGDHQTPSYIDKTGKVIWQGE